MLDLITLQNAVTLRPYDPRAYEEFCRELCRRGRLDYAEDFFRRWLHIDPDNARAKHLMVACMGLEAPPRCSNEFLESEFDCFAPTFDLTLSQLGYVVPSLLANLVVAEAPAAGWDVLDLGCGTGLCGTVLRPIARRLVGVDVSTNMLSMAREHGDYDELHRAEVTDFLTQHPAEYDVIIAGDMLIYFGELRPLFTAIAAALKPNGRFVASTELLDDANANYQLQPTGRYAHTHSYMQQHAGKYGLELRSLSQATIRREAGQAVQGLILRTDRLP